MNQSYTKPYTDKRGDETSELHPAIVFHRDGTREETDVPLVREVPLTVSINGVEVLTLLCAGVNLESLSVGFLKSEGLLNDRTLFDGVTVDVERGTADVKTREDARLSMSLLGKRTVTTGCGKGTTFYNSLDALKSRRMTAPVKLGIKTVQSLMGALNENSELYRLTHGVHNCGLALGSEIIIFRSDIGRHNALDMIVGECFLSGIPTDDKILLTTGRITSEILIKCAKVGFSAVVSRSAATAMAVELAREMNITTIGRVRAGSATVYTGIANIEHDR